MATLRGSVPKAYEGYCRGCGQSHAWRNDGLTAEGVLAALFDRLESDPLLRAEREALGASPGKMLGVLVTDHGVLRAYSGELGGRRDWPGWVEPVLRRADTAELETITLARIEALDREIQSCDVPAAQRRLDEARGRAGQDAARSALLEIRGRLAMLRRARREASQALSTAMFEAATVTNARGERRPLREIFVGDRIAGGTTDCCVPKLLEAANVRGWRPVALAEAWWGPSIGGRRHGDLQPPCERKCLPILGHLLCGITPDGERRLATAL